MLAAFRNICRAASIALVAALLLPVGASAATLTTLAGQTFIAPPDFLSIHGACTASGPSTFSFHASNFPHGTPLISWEETGTFTLASPNGPLTSFDATFTVYQTGQPNLNGMKRLATPSSGSCTNSPFGFTTNVQLVAETSYSTTGLFPEAGFASTSLNSGNLAVGGAGSFFTEGPFTPGPAPLAAGCDSQGNGNGDDQCLQ